MRHPVSSPRRATAAPGRVPSDGGYGGHIGAPTTIDELEGVRVMPVWQVALVLNLTFAVGLGLGYAGWGRRAEALDREFDAPARRWSGSSASARRARPARAAGEQQWEGAGSSARSTRSCW